MSFIRHCLFVLYETQLFIVQEVGTWKYKAKIIENFVEESEPRMSIICLLVIVLIA